MCWFLAELWTLITAHLNGSGLKFKTRQVNVPGLSWPGLSFCEFDSIENLDYADLENLDMMSLDKNLVIRVEIELPDFDVWSFWKAENRQTLESNLEDHDPNFCQDKFEQWGSIPECPLPQFAGSPPATWKWVVGPFSIYMIEEGVEVFRFLRF